MNTVLIIIIILLALTSYFFGRRKAYSIQAGERLTALPKFYGYYLAIWCAAPAIILFCFWSIFEPNIVRSFILSDYSGQNLSDNQLNLLYEKVKALAAGTFTGEISNFLANSAEKYDDITTIASTAKFTIVLGVLILTLSYGYTRVSKNIRTREPAEKFIEYLLLFASFAAVMTTVGICL